MSYESVVTPRLAWLPEISAPERAFGTSRGLADMKAALSHAGSECQGFNDMVDRMFGAGLEAMICVTGSEDCWEVLNQEDHKRLHVWLHACLLSWELKHEHKIAAIAQRLDETLLGLAYFQRGDTQWRIAGIFPHQDQLPAVEEVREHLNQR